MCYVQIFVFFTFVEPFFFEWYLFRELRRFSLIVRTFSKPLERNKNIKTNVSNNLSNCFHGIGLIRGPNAVFWLTLVISVLRIRQTSCKWVVNATILHYLEANKRNIMQGKARQVKERQFKRRIFTSISRNVAFRRVPTKWRKKFGKHMPSHTRFCIHELHFMCHTPVSTQLTILYGHCRHCNFFYRFCCCCSWL